MELSTKERLVLAIDTSDEQNAQRLSTVAREAGAKFVKFGLELSSTTSWGYCSELAAQNNLEWIADAKLNDIPNTTAQTVQNISNLDYPPYGITIHTTSGKESMQAAQNTAQDTTLFGVTVLSSISLAEAARVYRVPMRQKVFELAKDAAAVGLGGLVSSPSEVGLIKRDPSTRDLITLVPGIRSRGVTNYDQSRVGTPTTALDDGADLLVIGRQVTLARDPSTAFKTLVKEIQNSL